MNIELYSDCFISQPLVCADLVLRLFKGSETGGMNGMNEVTAKISSVCHQS